MPISLHRQEKARIAFFHFLFRLIDLFLFDNGYQSTENSQSPFLTFFSFLSLYIHHKKNAISTCSISSVSFFFFVSRVLLRLVSQPAISLLSTPFLPSTEATIGPLIHRLCLH
ncbi:hypothetical protein CEXT_246711 [Caerostris extrusa]|uniref:Uncharacterized protein n=1 Tax=Caerostris extrusa TaxID=172846 RepID=A0AAV4XI64_CAEEX|nr:hypothetical protein CEXT_246711 [Caerostris extrusa]